MFRRHRRKHGKYLGTIAMTWLRCGERKRALSAAWRSVRVDPARPGALVQLVASLAGPAIYTGVARLRTREQLGGTRAQRGAGSP